mmetsp:Transcript_14674/g.23910  ORF Transcript_14674/g.23910 Transcript_14674/m.23910 type:complete len:481 (-) Transcript_14674:117-1559(-)
MVDKGAIRSQDQWDDEEGNTNYHALDDNAGGDEVNGKKSMPNGHVVAICWAWCLSGIVQTLPSSFFPSQVAEFGVSDLSIGLIFSAYQTLMIISTPAAVTLTPRIGAVTLVRGCLVCLLITNGMMAFTFYCRHHTATFVASALILRGLSGLSSCGIMIGGNTCIMQSSNLEHLGQNLSVFETAGSVGLCIGPMLGSYLFTIGGYKTTFIGLSLLMISGMAFLPSTPPPKEAALREKSDPNQEAREGSSSVVGFTSVFLRSPFLSLLCFDLLVAGVAWTFIDPILEKRLRDANNLGQMATGGFFAVMSFCYILATAVVGILAKRHHASDCWNLGAMYFGMGLLAAALILLASNYIPFELGALALLGVGQAFTYLPVVLALTVTLRGVTDEDVSATVAGVSQFFVSVGFALGPFLGSEVTSRVSFSSCCIWISTTVILGAVLTAIAFGCEASCFPKTPQECRAGTRRSLMTQVQQVAKHHAQ